MTIVQLRAAGLSDSAIARRAADGRLQRRHHGVYGIAHLDGTAEAGWIAAVLASGPEAVLSHRSAACAWGLVEREGLRPEVTARPGGGQRHPGIWAHRCRLVDEDRTTHRGVPITTPARTLLDLAEEAPQVEVDRALEEAMRTKVLEVDDLLRLIDRTRGRRGLKRLRRAITRARLDLPAAPTRSELERRMLALIRHAGLPRPEVNAHVAGYEADLLWRGHRLAVEVDGYAFHHTPQAFDRDRRRDADLAAAGLRVQRFSWRQVVGEEDWVAEVLRGLLA